MPLGCLLPWYRSVTGSVRRSVHAASHKTCTHAACMCALCALTSDHLRPTLSSPNTGELCRWSASTCRHCAFFFHGQMSAAVKLGSYRSLVRTRVSCARVHASLLINNVSLVMPSSMLACYCSCSRMLLFMSCFSAPSMLACWHAGMVSPVASSAFQQSRSVNREAAFGCVSAVQR